MIDLNHVRYLVDEEGHPTAAVIDIAQWEAARGKSVRMDGAFFGRSQPLTPGATLLSLIDDGRYHTRYAT